MGFELGELGGGGLFALGADLDGVAGVYDGGVVAVEEDADFGGAKAGILPDEMDADETGPVDFGYAGASFEEENRQVEMVGNKLFRAGGDREVGELARGGGGYRATATTVAPQSFAICTAAEPTPPAAPSIQGTNLFYGLTATFNVGVSTLNPGVVFSADKCSNITPAASEVPTSLAYKCEVTGTGTLTFVAKDSQGNTLASQAFNVPAPQVQATTSLGTVVFELDPAKAPLSVNNFLKYVSSGFYTGTIFHRVIPNFVVQAGGFTSGLTKMTPTNAPITLESNNGLSNLTGTLAMARTADPNSATSQFYVNLVDNTSLDYTSSASPGYAVFGKVTTGIAVINAIGSVPTGTSNGLTDVPTTEVVITSMKRIK